VPSLLDERGAIHSVERETDTIDRRFFNRAAKEETWGGKKGKPAATTQGHPRWSHMGKTESL